MIPAQVRTLVPARLVVFPVFFSMISEIIAWIALLGWNPTSLWYGNSALLAATHLITLGGLMLALLGMGWQLVPVATGVRPKKGWNRAAEITNYAAIIGTILFTSSLFGKMGLGSMIGGILVILSLIVRSIFVLRELLFAKGRKIIRIWLVFAEFSLWIGLGYGIILLANRLGSPLIFLQPFEGIADHVAFLLFGWVGGWIVAMASILVPMFLVSPEPNSKILAGSGIFWFSGIAFSNPILWFLGVLLFVFAMMLSLFRRIRRKISSDLRVALFGIFWMLALAILLLANTPLIITIVAAFAIFTLPVLHGIGLRIIPFLFWAYGFHDNVKEAPTPAQLINQKMVTYSANSTPLAGFLLVGGIYFQQIWLWRAGILLGIISASTYLFVIFLTAFHTWTAHNRLQASAGTRIKEQ